MQVESDACELQTTLLEMSGSFSQVYSSALQLFHPPFHTVDLLLTAFIIVKNNM